MTPQSLQRFVVRMLFDPAFVTQVYNGDAIPDLDSESRAMLTQPDQRAWGTDPYRRMRALTALLEEFPASAAQAGVPKLDAYFSSEIFHRVCQDRGSMALGFGAWIEALVGPLARLETALATIRRPQPTTGQGIALSPSAAVVTLPAGTLDQYQALRAQLGPNPLVTIAQGTVRPVARPDSLQTDHLIVQATPTGDISLTTASPTLARLLLAADPPVARHTLQAEARALGADPGEEDEIIDDLIKEGLLTQLEG